jgi:hypothetical protein
VQSSTLAARILIVALGATWLYLAWGVWNYLQVGYSLRVGLQGGPASVSRIVFPVERQVVAIALALAVVAACGAAASGHRFGSRLLLVVLVSATAIGLWDADTYGIVMTPTKISSLAVLAAAYIASRYAASRAPDERS